MQARRFIISQTKHIVWLMLLVPATFLPSEAQVYFFSNYGVKQGLSTNKVYTLLQDSKDYIWLGTENGLSRFDGRDFENFSSHDGLAADGVKSMVEDPLGNIWFGHLNGGVSRYNGHVFEIANFDSLTISGDITSIAITGDKMWFTSFSDGAILTDFPVKEISHIPSKQFKGKEGLSDQVVGSEVNKAGEFICVTDAGLRKYYADENKFENYRLPKMTTYFHTTCLLEDSSGNVWLGTYNGGIYKYSMTESAMTDFDLIRKGLASNIVSCLTEDSRGRIWIGTWEGGVAVLDGGKLRKFDLSNGLAASRIYDIIEDVEGNILIADQNYGLTIYKGDAFVTYSDPMLLPDGNVNAIYQDRSGAFWFGTNKGISRFSPESSAKPAIYNMVTKSIFEYIKFFKEDRQGNLWIGADDGGVIKYNMTTSQFEAQPYINSQLPRFSRVTALETDQRNNLWIGTIDGVTVGTINEQNFQRYTTMDSLTINSISALFCDMKGNMWIGAGGTGETGKRGLIKYDVARDDFTPIASFSGITPTSMAMDSDGTLWIGTGVGLMAYRSDSIIKVLTRADGLLSDNINLVTIGDEGSIFIGTNNGLNRYFPKTGRIFSYTENNGFPGIETKPNAVFQDREGSIWFGTSDGATRHFPHLASTKEMEPLTHIDGIWVNYKQREMTHGMKLGFKERSIWFDYYSICLTDPSVVRYKVKLEGADEDWQPVTDQTRTIYSALHPGKYRFMVMARNNQGIWNTNPVTFDFTIKPPFYQTWWFIVFTLIFAIAIIVLYIKNRERNLKKEKVILERRVVERTAEVVQKSLIIEEKNRDITASIRYAERIQRAMLPPDDMFAETFVFFRPKDIVSGDFYWMFDTGDRELIAAVDCTGHGVPGAFMSIIGHNSLNKIVREYGIIKPAAILDQLNKEIVKALLQRHETTVTDGMDLALIAYDKKSRILEFAGAYNPVYLVRNGETIVHKADRFPIGMTSVKQKKDFTNFEISVLPGDMIYLSTDGFADQFGGPKGSKYMSASFKKLLGRIYKLPLKEQRKRLEDEITEWQGPNGQVDDILVIGKRIV
jgi:ligand-binding sensor domain-containing protein/serine phosphatase RsbU (regulator of sigma subunit)